jgi:RHS repeat-associated protein
MLQDVQYGYDDAGNVLSISDPTTLGGSGEADNQCFAYDGYRRLTEAWSPKTADCSASGRTTANLDGASPYWTSYTYSDAGLRQTETEHTTAGSTTQTYCYDSGRLHALLSTTTSGNCLTSAQEYDYDDSGNTTTRTDGPATQSLEWSSEGKLATLTEGSAATGYLYDADGNLLLRRNAKGESVLYLGATEVHYDAATGDIWGQRYYTASGTTIAVRTNESGTEKLSFLAGDAHGTSTLAVAATDLAVTKRYFTPFGEDREGGTGTWTDDKSFLGMTADEDTGLTHVGAREYDPSIGRFISVDPLLTLDQPQSLNGYSYANNTPVTQSDPTGQESCYPHFCSGSNGTYGDYKPENDPASDKYDGSSHDTVTTTTTTTSLFNCLCGVVSPTPYFDPAWANDPEIRNWANSNQKGPLANALYGVGLPVTTALDWVSALFTPACIVQDQCLTDKYKAWGKEHGFNPDSNSAGVGAAAGSFIGPMGKGGAEGRGKPGPPKPGPLGGLPAAGAISPKAVRFSQDSIGAKFSDGRSVSQVIEDLKAGRKTADDIPPIRIFERDGKKYTLDNRRLYVFQQAGVNIRFQRATAAEVENQSWKFTTQNDGTSIVVRGK